VSWYCFLAEDASDAVKQGAKKAAEKAEEVDRWASREKEREL
jgi:hypothetical protein